MANEQSAENRDQDKQAEGAEPELTGEGPHAEGAEPELTGEGPQEPPETAAPEAEADDAAAAAQEGGDDPTEGAAEKAPTSDDASHAEIERLQKALAAAESRADENWQRVLRMEAEKENVRKRAERDVESAHKYGVEKMANELLAVRDSLELGVDAARQEDADVAKVLEGTELTLRMLTQAMEKFGIESIDPLGEKFDPEYHQAMSMQDAEGYDSNTVFQVMQKGYRLKERLLRPALVMVAK